MARAVFGLPTFSSASSVEAVLKSLLGQDYQDLAVVAIDDASPDQTACLAKAVALRDPRLTVEVNPERLGMIANWNRVLERARELHPEFEYFAWASDNDLRRPDWLSALIRLLDETPDAALAYTEFGRLDPQGQITPQPPGERRRFEFREPSPAERFRAVVRGFPAGSIMFGLHRRSTLETVGDIPPVVNSDVLFLSYLSLFGTFVQEPRELWYRGRQRTGSGRRRQRRALFAGRPPVLVFGPVWLQHAAWLLRAMAAGRRPAGIGRASAFVLILRYVGARWVRQLARWRARWTRVVTWPHRRRIRAHREEVLRLRRERREKEIAEKKERLLAKREQRRAVIESRRALRVERRRKRKEARRAARQS
jgi:glycosyltransferase involved in cell wall biosynthesis